MNKQLEYPLQQDALYKSTIALAGVVQAVSLVKEFAQAGKMDEAAFEASIYSIFQTNPDDITTIYGGLEGVRFGLTKLIPLFESQTNPIPIRYMLSVLRLQKKVFRSKKTVSTLTQRIQQTKKQVDYFSLTHPTVIANLADTYLLTTSPFKHRIIIWGNQRILNASENMEKIRALLFAGIRSAVLWRQMGGSRLQFIFFRHRIKSMAQKILAGLPAAE